MAVDGNNERMIGIRGMGRAQILRQVMEDVSRREGGKFGIFLPISPSGQGRDSAPGHDR